MRRCAACSCRRPRRPATRVAWHGSDSVVARPPPRRSSSFKTWDRVFSSHTRRVFRHYGNPPTSPRF
jgi:hypothetical protein